MRNLTWTTSASADDLAHDQETDLGTIGSPGGAAWASVSPEGSGWNWAVYDRWLLEDGDILDCGHVATEDEAKAAVAAWVAEEEGRLCHAQERTARDNAGLLGTRHGARPCKGNHAAGDCTGWMIPVPKSYRITIEPLTGPAGHPTGRKACEAEGSCVSDALRSLAAGLAGMNEEARYALPEGFEPL